MGTNRSFDVSHSKRWTQNICQSTLRLVTTMVDCHFYLPTVTSTRDTTGFYQYSIVRHCHYWYCHYRYSWWQDLSLLVRSVVRCLLVEDLDDTHSLDTERHLTVDRGNTHDTIRHDTTEEPQTVPLCQYHFCCRWKQQLLLPLLIGIYRTRPVASSSFVRLFVRNKITKNDRIE